MSQWTLDDPTWNTIYMGLSAEKSIQTDDELSVFLFLSAVLYILETGVAWRHLPKEYGRADSVYHRFRRWAKRGVWFRLFQTARDAGLLDQDAYAVCIDATICKAQRSAPGGRGRDPKAEGLGRSRGGMTTKIHAAVSTTGQFLALRLTPGQSGDSLELPKLLVDIEHFPVRYVLADKAYDGSPCRDAIAGHGAEAVIPSKKNRIIQIPHDVLLYKTRNIIERTFCRLKDAMRITTRRDKTRSSYMSFVYLGAYMLNARLANRMRFSESNFVRRP